MIILNKNLSWLYDINIAHRGLHNLSKNIPENTIYAFDKAIKENLAIELDVHILKDNTVIVFHDDTLKRCCNIDKKVKDLTYSEIASLNLFNTEHKIPTLEDAICYIDGKVPVIIEIKTDKSAFAICPKLVQIIAGYKGKLAVKSFDPSIIWWFKKYYPAVPRGLLVADFNTEKHFKYVKKLFLSSLIFMPICKPDFLSVQLNMLKSKKIKKIKKSMVILGWTFRSKLDRINYEAFCDSYIFEDMQ